MLTDKRVYQRAKGMNSGQCGLQPGMSIGIWVDEALDVKHSTSASSASDDTKKAARTERSQRVSNKVRTEWGDDLT